MNNFFDIFGPSLIASFSSAVCYLVARRDFPPRAAVLVVIGVLIVGPVLAQLVGAWTGVSAGWLGLSFGFAVRNAALRVIAELPYLSPVHHAAVEKLVRDLLKRLGAKEDDDIALDPLKVAMLVSDEINRRYVSQAAQFELVDTPKKMTPGGWRSL
jgi:hypothetical protein